MAFDRAGLITAREAQKEVGRAGPHSFSLQAIKNFVDHVSLHNNASAYQFFAEVITRLIASSSGPTPKWAYASNLPLKSISAQSVCSETRAFTKYIRRRLERTGTVSSRSLFPAARLIPLQRRAKGAGHSWRVVAVDVYVGYVGPRLEKDGFFEKEVSRKTEAWGNIAQVFSVYESRRNADDPKPFMRGINSIQLLNDGNRWWLKTVLWDNEDDNNKLPETYLK